MRFRIVSPAGRSLGLCLSLAFGLSLALSSACAAARTPLPASAWIEPWTRADAMPSLVADPDAPGMRLKPGDVLYLRRWSTGLKGGRNDTTPPHAIDRVPLRRIRADRGRLHDGEMTLLVNFLVTNRSEAGVTNEPLGRDLSAFVKANSVAMWEALLDTLAVQRVNADTLRVVADLPAMLKAVQLPDPLRAYFAGGPAKKEIAGFATPPATLSPFDSMAQPSSANSNYYQTATGDLRGRMFTFVAVDLNGVDLRRPGYEESAWTLRELEDSGICTAVAPDGKPLALKIDALQLPGSGKAYRIVDDANHTHKLAYAFTAGQHYREFVPDPNATNRSRRRASLQRAALDEMSIRDISRLVWRLPDGQKPPNVPPRCQPR
jgi:hypothetical protein